MEKLKSEGHCAFCNKIFSKSTITRHLNSHLDKMEKANPNETSYHIKIENDPRYSKSPYFINLWLSHKVKFEDIDDFLRSIWLECCGHLSSFTDIETLKSNRNIVNIFNFDKQIDAEISMSKKISKIFYEGQKLRYEYDFGSSTTLLITVVAVLAKKASQKITLLSRNEPLEYLCDSCKKEPATMLCNAHDWEEDALFCKKCAKKHAKVCDDFEDYAAMPIVNSPRMGICGYEGGTIDLERDGAFVKK